MHCVVFIFIFNVLSLVNLNLRFEIFHRKTCNTCNTDNFGHNFGHYNRAIKCSCYFISCYEGETMNEETRVGGREALHQEVGVFAGKNKHSNKQNKQKEKLRMDMGQSRPQRE